MKQKFTLIAAAALVAILYTSCKKDIAVVQKKTPTVNEDAMAKQVALNLYKSLYGQLSTNTLSASGSNTLFKVMSEHPDCGKEFPGTTDRTEVSGDTTRILKGRSLYKWMCDGYFSNGWNVDAYTAYDSLYVTEKGTGFNNYSSNVQSYVVKTLDSHYAYVSVGGRINSFSHISHQNGSGITYEYYDLGTQYKLNDIKTKAGSNAQFVQGVVDFNTSNIFKDATTDVDGFFGYYSGHIRFLNENKAKIYFKNSEGTYTRYDINFKTGEIGKPVQNVPFE